MASRRPVVVNVPAADAVASAPGPVAHVVALVGESIGRSADRAELTVRRELTPRRVAILGLLGTAAVSGWTVAGQFTDDPLLLTGVAGGSAIGAGLLRQQTHVRRGLAWFADLFD